MKSCVVVFNINNICENLENFKIFSEKLLLFQKILKKEKCRL